MRHGQLPVVEALLEYWDAHTPFDTKGYIVAPTGAGKTVIMATLLESLRLRGELPKTLIAVPTKKLVEQTYQELIDRGFKGAIRVLKHSYVKDTEVNEVVVTTYAALSLNTTFKPKHAMRAIQPDKYGLVVCDEAHHLQGESTRITLSQNFRHARQLGFTATDDYDDKRQLRNILPDLICELSTEECVEYGMIAPYLTSLLGFPTDMSQVRVRKRDYDPNDIEAVINTDVRNYALAKFVADNLQGKKIMFNVGRVAHAEALAEALRYFGVRAMAVSGQQSDRELTAITEAFHDGTVTAVTQAKILGEGYDEPAIDVVVNVTPTLSYVWEKQRTGRGQRIDPNNPDKTLLVIECIDTNYVRKPVLYGHKEVTGHWRLGQQGVTDHVLHSNLHALAEQHHDGVKFTCDSGQIEQWYHHNQASSTLYPHETVEPIELHNDDVAPLQIEDIMPSDSNAGRSITKEQRAPRSSSRSLFIAEPNAQQVKANEAAQRSRARRAELFDYSDHDDDEAQSVVTGLEKLPEAVRVLVSSVLAGQVAVEPTTSPHHIRLALKAIAGTLELDDPIVLANYRKLNELLVGKAPQLLADDSEVVRTVSHRKHVGPIKDLSLDVDFDRDSGACKGSDQDMFFPGRGESTQPAKEVCASCNVKEDCLDHALKAKEKFGIWGGLSEHERRRIRLRTRATLRQDESTITPVPTDPEVSDELEPTSADIDDAERLFGAVAFD